MNNAELDPAIVRRRLDHLAAAVSRLQGYRGVPLAQLESDDGTDWIVLHGLQLAIQAVLDISSYIVATSDRPVPDQYRSGILALATLKILPQDFAERIAAMAGFRNILVHGYLEVDMSLVKQILDEQLDDFVTFGQHIGAYLDTLHNGT